MSLPRGARLGPYEVVASLGAGGMGEVYKARDTRLDRTVAVKVMTAAIAATPELRQRFEREARSLSALNHPHICTLHDVGLHEGQEYLVLEFVEGETLASRLSRGPMPPDEVMRRGAELAAALDRAHRAGVVHRDLKPANIMLTKSGVKVLDFGLARLKTPDSQPGVSIVTGVSPGLTGQGTILGTMQYMSPEQLRGGETDARSDIFALGLVLYEMATGRRAFEASSQAGLIAAILEREPSPMTAESLHGAAPSDAFERLVRRCLAKDPDDRWQSARDVMLELQAMAAPVSVVAAPVATRPSTRGRSPWIIAAVMTTVGLISVAALLSGVGRRAPADAAELRLQVSTPTTPAPTSIALSPDGRQLAFVAARQEGSQAELWVRNLDSIEARHLPGTEGALFPFWSADGRSLAFFADAKLKRYDLAGGVLQTLAPAPLGRGGTWNQDGVIIFAPAVGELYRIAASEGTAAPLTKVNPPHETSHRFPQFLPDGRHFIYFVQGSTEVQGIYLASLDDPKGKRLMSSDARAMFMAPDTLLFLRQGTVLGQRLDLTSGALSGEPLKLADRVMFDGAFNTAALTASTTGLIAYREGSENELAWVDRSGKSLGVVPMTDPAPQNCPEISPDGKRVAIDRTVNGNRDIWLFDLERKVPRKFTFDSGIDATPLWSPDGTQIVFRSNRTGTNQLYVKAVNRDTPEERLPASEMSIGVSDWSRDGKIILFMAVDPATSLDLWAYSIADRKSRPVVKSQFEDREGQLSTDGKWLTFATNDSGRMDVFVQAFPDAGERFAVSTSGGSQPRWRRDGRELFYIAANGSLMAATFSAAGGRVQIGTPTALFHPRISTAQGGLLRHQYAVSVDGQRFLLNAVAEEAAKAPITIIANWHGPARR
jgi:serine/threonine protein kinase/Tol biopolymer transport system component